MADLTIDDIWTFEDVNNPTDRFAAFFYSSFLPPSDPSYYVTPFGIAMQVTSAITQGVDIRFQIVNFRGDPGTGKMWFGRNGVQTSLDLDGDTPGLSFLHAAVLPPGPSLLWIWWQHYTDLFGPVGSGLLPTICELRAQIQSGFHDRFAVSRPGQWTFSFVD